MSRFKEVYYCAELCPSKDEKLQRGEAVIAVGLIHGFQTAMARMQRAFECVSNAFERLSLVSPLRDMVVTFK